MELMIIRCVHIAIALHTVALKMNVRAGYIGFTRVVRCFTELIKFSASSFKGMT